MENNNIGEIIFDYSMSNEDYICTLSHDAKRFAQRELSEEEHTRNLALRQVREWITNNPNIQKCRMDNNFLLRFLRIKKFRVGEAQQLIEKYLKMRSEYPAWFNCLDIKNSRLDDLINRGYFFALPERDDFGRRVFFSVGAAIDSSRDTAADMMRGVQVGLESLIEDEENQVRGFSYVFDQRNVGLSVVTMWTPGEVSKAFHCSEKTIPMRHKEIHFLHLPITLYAVFEFAKTLLSEKIKKRFHVHNNIERLRKVVPVRILPKEYGGIVPISDMIESYKEELKAVRCKVLSLDDIRWSKIAKHKKLERTVSSLQHSVRKLEID